MALVLARDAAQVWVPIKNAGDFAAPELRHVVTIKVCVVLL